ncbi:transcriptional regulatory protein [Sinomonas cyclohexanicum]|uniref:Transcriptional regulatory protein n=1 Tax=Sinomonas cyclohexanicum TaxID=322009 RepID=A0ABN6FLD6_SINCY|nr:response regulator [Corynebacterium cyclohexanicum]BCT77627.1 transcriptional regulatory protein [Corynebacterium cyclohexanicum]
MIRVLVVDDDYRVARLHAAQVGKVAGYECVGEAHTAAEARAAIARGRPDLLLLDVYLPDEDGISLLRSLREAGEDVDVIIITAARDVATVRAAMRGGAVHYLVKPFGFEELAGQLGAYRRWRADAESRSAIGITGQTDVDALFASQRAGGASARPGPAAARRLPPTMQKVLDAVLDAGRPLGAQDVSGLVGISRPTAQRYLSELERKGRLTLHLEYGATGRPVNTYVPRSPGNGG